MYTTSGILATSDALSQGWKNWKQWISVQIGQAAEPTLPLHCTLLYDEYQDRKDYDACWNELINKKPYYITTQDIYIGPQGAAASVLLPQELQEWFQVQNSMPHVTLLIANGRVTRVRSHG